MIRVISRRLGNSTINPHSQSNKIYIKGSKCFDMVSREVEAIKSHIQSLVNNRHNSVLDHAGKYTLEGSSKLMRPALIVLMAHAMVKREVSMRFSESEIGSLNDITPGTILPFLRLAEVTELIHTASLVHDDVIDNSDMRRGRPALHTVYGIKHAILAGDYLLARASLYIATLQMPRIVVLMSTALEELTTGELMQMDGCFNIEHYEQKSFCKTASLISNSLASTAVLADPGNEELELLAFKFGKHLGIAFQIVDDCLDIMGDEKELLKPKMADLNQGIATMPVLLAAQKDSKVDAAVRRRFTAEGDIDYCIQVIKKMGTVDEALQKANDHCQLGLAQLRKLHASPARDSLEASLKLVLERRF
ncbi:unnamed protein product [Phytomonas sp. Hart1]|nr:unnamed protein product [Phytomonas sp. Hart1]|eukprot:CCW67793.1 unnamed protein product [Phytomonas sp. isolate Hart1]